MVMKTSLVLMCFNLPETLAAGAPNAVRRPMAALVMPC